MARVLPLAVAVYLHSVASAFAINIVGNAPINPWAWALVCGFIVGLLGLVAWMIARDARQKRPVRARSGEEVMVDFLMGHTRRGWTRNETVLPDVQIVHGPEHGTASVRPITNGILAGRLGDLLPFRTPLCRVRSSFLPIQALSGRGGRYGGDAHRRAQAQGAGPARRTMVSGGEL
jgi:hypothetical protein